MRIASKAFFPSILIACCGISATARGENDAAPTLDPPAACANLRVDVDGIPVPVDHLKPACPQYAPDWFVDEASHRLEVHVAAFACPHPSKLAIHLQQPVKHITVRPKHAGIAVAGKERDWTLGLPGPCKLYVEVPSLPPLLIFADPPEPGPPAGGPRTRIFGPGVHVPGLITLEDNDQVYLAPGAVVYGGLRGSPHNAKVFGRGVLDGSRLNAGMVRLDRVRHLVVEGIIMRCGRSWQNRLQNCDDVVYRNVKVLSFVPCGDGLDPVCCRNIRIEDCFFRCSDDCIGIKAMKGGPKISGILVQNCVMAGYTFGDGLTVGFEADTESVEDITVRNCDILFARGGNTVGHHSAFSIICDGPAVVRNVTFEDIRVEDAVAQMFELNVTDGTHYTKTPPGHIRHVRLKDIQWETAKPLLLRGHDKDHLVEDVVFEGCRVGGRPLSSAQIEANEFVKGVVIH